MNRSYYNFGIFLLGLSVVCGLLQSIVQFQIGGRMYFLQPFANWFLVVNIIGLAATALVLKYFHYRKYWFTFWAGLIASVVIVCQVVLVYIMLIFVARELRTYTILLAIPFLATSIVFALSLVFSEAGKKPWLKASGVAMFVLYTFFGSAFTWGLISQDFFMTSTFVKIEQWTGALSNLILVFFLMNFRAEVQSSPVSGEHTRQFPNADGVLTALGLMALVFTFSLGVAVARESYWVLRWSKRGAEKARELSERFESHTYINSRSDTLRYLLKKPFAYDPEKKYPLVVCLHGGPVTARSIEVPEPAPFLSDSATGKQYPAFIFVPQGPPGHTWGGIPPFPSVDSLVFGAMAVVEEQFPIDASRRYVAGGSMGGYGAWYFIGTRPKMFAAAIPYCGAGDPALAKNMVNIPVWAFHGTSDRNVSVNGSREMIEAIRKAGGNPRYTEFLGTGHNVWPEINKTPGVMEWLFKQRRE